MAADPTIRYSALKARGTSLLGLLRHGNAYTSAGAREYVEKFFAQFPETEYDVRFRGDSGFYDKEIIALLSQKKAEFAIVADMTKPIKERIQSLRYRTFHKAGGWQAARFIYTSQAEKL